MDASEIMKKLDELLEERKKLDAGAHAFYVFKEKGERFYGRIIDELEDKYGRTRYLAEELNTGEEYVLPGHTVLKNKFDELNVKIGDFVVIEYLGTREKSDGSEVHLYEVAKFQSSASDVDEDEVDRMLKSIDDALEDADEDEEEVEIETSNSVEEDEEESADEATEESSEDFEEAKRCLENMLKIVDSVSISEADYYLKQIKKLNIKDVKTVAKAIGCKIDEERNEIIRVEE